jgi:hypothetical protein
MVEEHQGCGGAKEGARQQLGNNGAAGKRSRSANRHKNVTVGFRQSRIICYPNANTRPLEPFGCWQSMHNMATAQTELIELYTWCVASRCSASFGGGGEVGASSGVGGDN